MIYKIKSLWDYLDKKYKKNLILLFILMVVASFFEVISIGAVMPFIAVLTSPESIYHHESIYPVVSALGLKSPDQIILPVTILFMSAIIIAGVMRVFLLYSINIFERNVGVQLNIDVFCHVLYKDYKEHINHNSGYMISLITKKTDTVIRGVVRPLLILISSVTILFFITSLLIFISIEATAIVIFTFGTIYWCINWFVRNRREINSKSIAKNHTKMIKTLQEGSGGIRDIIIHGSQNFYCSLFSKSDFYVRNAIADNDFIATSPRFIIEALGVSIISILAYFLSQQDNSSIGVLPLLGLLAMGAQRLLPLLQATYVSISNINGSKYSFDEVMYILKSPMPDFSNKEIKNTLVFNNEIKLVDVVFKYNKGMKPILRGINLTISKGDSIGFIGKTGSGKSTLLDVITGLVMPTSGYIQVDNNVVAENNIKAWQANIAYVSQDVYLFDGTIADNIAFGQSAHNIKLSLLKKCAKTAHISEYIESLKDGYQTTVGERGVKLSGGQIQRIGIARALYRQANVLIFDESTSALDSRTEEVIIGSINKLDENITILMVAHRITTLKNCNKIVELHNGSVLRVCGYNELHVK